MPRRIALLAVLAAVVSAPLVRAVGAPYTPTGIYVPDGEAEYGSWININNEPDYLRIWKLRDREDVYKFWIGFATSTESAYIIYKEPVHPVTPNDTNSASTSASSSASHTATVTEHASETLAPMTTLLASTIMDEGETATMTQGASETYHPIPVRRRWDEVENYLYERDISEVGIEQSVGNNYYRINIVDPKPENGLMFFRLDLDACEDPESIVWGFSAMTTPLSFVSGADYSTYDAASNAIIAFIPFADMPVSRFAMAIFRNTTLPGNGTLSTTTATETTTHTTTTAAGATTTTTSAGGSGPGPNPTTTTTAGGSGSQPTPTEGNTVSGQLFLDANRNGRYDAGIDTPYAFIQVELRAPIELGPVRRLKSRSSTVISRDITSSTGTFSFRNIASEVLAAIRAASTNGTASLTVVAAAYPDIPLQVVGITEDNTIEQPAEGETINIALPPEFLTENPEFNPPQVNEDGTPLTTTSTTTTPTLTSTSSPTTTSGASALYAKSGVAMMLSALAGLMLW